MDWQLARVYYNKAVRDAGSEWNKAAPALLVLSAMQVQETVGPALSRWLHCEQESADSRCVCAAAVLRGDTAAAALHCQGAALVAGWAGAAALFLLLLAVGLRARLRR